MLRTLYAYPILLVSSSILTSVMESWWTIFDAGRRWGVFFVLFFCVFFIFGGGGGNRISIKNVYEPFISKQYTRNFGAKTRFIQRYSLMLHPFRQTPECVSKGASQQAGVALIS